ncbi:MAG: AAA family ATPase [Candidatus Krumholzibacteriota bacterium]|nr:AAA family ATPase [Candidatus Krumholzibacteriota bacterium]
MRTISVINQKGGCGKTTVSINLAAAFNEMGKRVLLVDLDPQAHASLGLRVRVEEVEHTAYDLLINPRVKIDDAATPIAEDFHIIPSSSVLSAIEQELSGKQARESRLLAKLDRIEEGRYDYVIIDSPPNVGLLTFNALVAAGEVIIPTEPSWFSFKGLQKLRDTLALLERETKRTVHVHVLINNLENRTTFSRDLVALLEQEHGGVLMESVISHSVRFKEAAMRGVSIFGMPNVDRLQREFLLLAEELEHRRHIVVTDEIDDWMVRLHGPRRVKEGILFAVDAPRAGNVYLTGEFTNWSREGMRMERDPRDGLWKTTLMLDPGEYEYRFIVDGVWIKDPANADSVLNEFGQENSLLIV